MADEPRHPSRPSGPSGPSRPDVRASWPSIAQRLSSATDLARGTVSPAVTVFRDPARLTARLWLFALRNDRRARAATAVLVGFGIIAVAGALSPPLVPRLEDALLAPSAVHPFGTDSTGRDVLMLLLQGTAGTLFGGLLAALAAAVLGVALGALAGWVRGFVDLVVGRAIEATHAVPSLLLVLVLQGLAPSPGTTSLLLAIVVTRWAEFARVVRADVLRVVAMDHVTAARALGASPSRILARHVLPAVISSALVLVAFAVGAVVVIEAAVAAVGIGAIDPLSWGALLAQARSSPFAWWLVAFPALLVVLVVAATSLLGEAMRDALDPRLRGTQGQARVQP